MSWPVILVGVFLALTVALFLGGMVSALVEGHREKAAGLPVSRPAWEARATRRAGGGTRAYLRGLAKGLRS